MYYLIDETIGMIREHAKLVDLDIESGHTKAARNELRKIKNVVESVLLPELDGLSEQVAKRGALSVVKEFPQLHEYAYHLEETRLEAESWLNRQL